MGCILSGHVFDVLGSVFLIPNIPNMLRLRAREWPTGPGLVVAPVDVAPWLNLICWQNSESAVIKSPVMIGAASQYEMWNGARNGNPQIAGVPGFRVQGPGSRVSHCSGVAENASLMFLFLFV